MIGAKLGNRYELTSVLGRGGMGVVYLAHDPVLDREVAVKLIAPTVLSPEIEQRFTREARVVAQMDHASIVGVYDFGAHEGSLFFVMPYVRGSSLRAWVKKEPVRLGDAIDIAIQAASALDYSHQLGVVHRDIKPENMMITLEGDTLRVRVTDFGLAFTTKENRITRTGTLMGSVSYFSPEQVAGRSVDPRSDLYSLGIVMYELLTGAPPFVGEMHNVLYRIANEMITPPRSAAPNVPAELDALVMQCVAKNPLQRPTRGKEIAEALQRLRARLGDSERAQVVAETVITNDASQPNAHVRQPLVGREKEFGELQKRLAVAMAGECQLAIVSGEGGIGKTRLLDALEGLAAAKGVAVLRSSFAEGHQAFPYQAYYDLIYAHLRGTGTASSPSHADLSDLFPELVALFPALGDLEPVRNMTLTGGRAQAPDQAGAFDLLARVFARIGAGRPLVLMLDDLQASTMSHDALQYIVLRLGPTPTLIVGAYTDTDVDKTHPLTKFLDSMKGSRRFANLTLGRLSASEHRLFVENLVGSTRLEPSLVQQLHDIAEGNPFVTREVLRALMDSGSIAKDASGEWSLMMERELSAEDLPATLQEAVEKRLDRLAEKPKQILTMASVLGRSFDVRDLEAIVDDDDLDAALDSLIVGGFLQEERGSRGDRLSFTSGVVCDAVYKALPRRKKRNAHQKAAEAVETRAKGKLERVYAQLLFHYVRADEAEKVRDLGLKQARHALANLLVDDAIEAARSVLTFIEDEDDAELRLGAETRSVLAYALRAKGSFDSALKEIETAINVHDKLGDTAAALAGMVTAAEIAWEARRVPDVKRWFERGLPAAKVAHDVESQRKLLLLGTTIANLRGEFEIARELQAQIAQLAKKQEVAASALPRGGSLRVGLSVEARATQPSEIGRDVEVEILSNVFETLVTTDAFGQLAPGLCKHWEAGSDSKSFVLALRDDVVFHDGLPLTAADVKASLEAATQPSEMPTIVGGAQRETASMFTVVDDHTLRVDLPEPLPIYPALLASPEKAIWRQAGGVALGTGPFRLESSERGRYRLSRNDRYYREPPRIDELDFQSGLPAAQIASQLRAGTLDIAGELSARDFDDLQRERRRGLSLLETVKKNVCYALFNARRGPCASATLREVMVDSVRPHELVWQSLGRFAQPALGLIPPGILGHDAGRRRTSIAAEVAQGKLAAAGLERQLLRAAVHPLLLDRYRAMTDALFAQWAELGISVDVQTHDMNSFVAAFTDPGRYDLIISRYIADYDDPDGFTYGFFHKTAGSQKLYFQDDELDRITEEARASTNGVTREKLYRRAESLLLSKHAVLPLFHEIDYRLISPTVHGAKLQAVPPYLNYSELARVERAVSGERRKGVLSIPVHLAVETLDPAVTSYTWQNDIIRLAFEPLTMVTEGEGIGPCLASEFRGEDGGRRFWFRLRDVRFHDDRRVTARDVRASWERALKTEASDSRSLLFPIQGAKALARGEATTLAGFEIVSPDEFYVRLDEPIAMFPALLASPVAVVVPEQGFRASGSWRDGFVGTGPFRVVRFEPGRTIELEANPNYWREGEPRVESIVFSLGVPRTELARALEEGRASCVMDIPAADAARLRAQPKFAKHYHSTPTLATLGLFFNSKRGLLVDESLRQEIAAALDVPGLVRRHASGLASPARSYTPATFLGHEPRVRGRAAFPPRREPLELTMFATANGLELWAGLVRELTEMLAAKGFRIRITPLGEAPQGALRRGDAELVLVTWVTDYPDADGMLYQSLVSGVGPMGGILSSPEIDRLLEEARRELDPAARQALYRSVEGIIADRTLLLPILHPHNHAFVQPGIQGGERLSTMIGYAYDRLSITS